MKTCLATSFLAAALTLAGCSAGTDHPVDDETTEGASDALSAYGKKLVGAWKVQSPGSFEFDELVLKSNGKYFWHHDIVCIKAPCPTGDEGTFIGYAPAKGEATGRLRLTSKNTKGDVRQFEVVLASDGASMKLSRFGAGAKFDAVGTWCQAVEQCAGQPNDIMIKCAGGYHSEPVCTDTNACSKTCVKDTPKCEAATQGGPTSCKPDTLWKDYASADCKAKGLELGKLSTRESCGDGTSRYVDYQCCPATAPAPCVVGGCSGQICAETAMISTCIWRPEFACYKTATCARDASGVCGWTKTPALDGCLASGGSCTYSDPHKRYVGYSTSQCSLIKFACDFAAGETYFSDACGCGCATK